MVDRKISHHSSNLRVDHCQSTVKAYIEWEAGATEEGLMQEMLGVGVGRVETEPKKEE